MVGSYWAMGQHLRGSTKCLRVGTKRNRGKRHEAIKLLLANTTVVQAGTKYSPQRRSEGSESREGEEGREGEQK